MAEIIVDVGDNLVETIGCEYSGELVRCKECRCGKHEFIDNMEWIYCKHHFDYWIPDDFCSYGEREGE